MSNGEMCLLTELTQLVSQVIYAQDIYIDGNRIGEIGAQLSSKIVANSEDGVVLAVATVDFKSQMILSGPETSSAEAMST